MIKIDLPIEQPNATTTLQSDIALLLNEVRSQISRSAKTEFSENTWGKLKTILWNAQGKKCCFCEKKVASIGEGDVEHYRPKRDAKCIDNKSVKLKNGYWWLAYEWKNFLFVCRTCNNQKSNRFPLIAESHRTAVNSEEAINTLGDLGKELPLLINPRFEDPAQYFSYDIGAAHSGRVYITQAGNSPSADKSVGSIEITDLNRNYRVNSKALKDTLLEDRSLIFLAVQKAVGELKSLERALSETTKNATKYPAETISVVLNDLNQSIAAQETIVSSFTRTSSEFAGMCRYYVTSEGYSRLIEN